LLAVVPEKVEAAPPCSRRSVRPPAPTSPRARRDKRGAVALVG
jgi:hypothetical protein